MKAIIPVAGEGTRLRPHTHTQPKPLLYVAGKPILGHILDKLKILGVKDLVLIVGYMGDKIKEYVDSAYNFNVDYVEQKDLLGLGHAIWLSKECVGDEPVLIILGDTVFEADFDSVLAEPGNYIGVKEVDDARRFGIVKLENDRISGFVEKPDVPPTNLAIVGIYLLKDGKKLFACLDRIINEEIKTKGEFQLTDALQLMLEGGEVMKTFKIEGWHDCGKKETLLETNRSILDVRSQSRSINGSILIDPVYISESAVIENSIVGPYVSIASGSVIKNSILKDTIVSTNANVNNMVMSSSLIGDRAAINGKMNHLNVGASTEIDFG